MKICSVVLSLFLLISCNASFLESNLDSEMNRLGVDTALIVSSNAIDEYPLWSPNSDYIVVNITGEWKRIELKNIYLTEAKWHEINIGVLATDERSFVELSKKEKDSFNKIAKFGARGLKTRDKTEITIEMKDFSSSMIIKKYGDKPNKIWDSNMENCHSLVLSPDEMYVAFLCELSGLFVMRLK